uniref:Uncharacterized protein n=1 Tax=Rhizophora mucronata TaxID=61149 RepID=A0A2P2N976_RHIMU
MQIPIAGYPPGNLYSQLCFRVLEYRRIGHMLHKHWTSYPCHTVETTYQLQGASFDGARIRKGTQNSLH